MSSSITITNPVVVDFLNSHCYDPNKFIGQLILNYSKNNQNETTTTTEKNENKIEIDKDELLKYYEEYRFFVNQKQNLINLSREHHKHFQQNLNRVKFQKTEKLFLKHLKIKQQQVFTCSICNVYNVSTKKGLITHERNCRLKNTMFINDEEDDGDDVCEEDEDFSEEENSHDQTEKNDAH